MGGMFSSSAPAQTSVSTNANSKYKYNTYADFQYLGANGINQIDPKLVNPNLTNPTKVRLSGEQAAAISNLKDKVAALPKCNDFDCMEGGGRRRKRKNKTRARKRSSKKSRRAK